MKPVILTLAVPELEPENAEVLAQFFAELAEALWQQTVNPETDPINADFDDPLPF